MIFFDARDAVFLFFGVLSGLALAWVVVEFIG